MILKNLLFAIQISKNLNVQRNQNNFRNIPQIAKNNCQQKRIKATLNQIQKKKKQQSDQTVLKCEWKIYDQDIVIFPVIFHQLLKKKKLQKAQEPFSISKKTKKTHFILPQVIWYTRTKISNKDQNFEVTAKFISIVEYQLNSVCKFSLFKNQQHFQYHNWQAFGSNPTMQFRIIIYGVNFGNKRSQNVFLVVFQKNKYEFQAKIIPVKIKSSWEDFQSNISVYSRRIVLQIKQAQNKLPYQQRIGKQSKSCNCEIM